MRPDLSIFDDLYNLGDISLGRLVPDKDYPDEDGQDPAGLERDTDFHVRWDENVKLRLSSHSKSFLSAKFTRFFKADAEKTKLDDFRVIAKHRGAYQLCQPKEVLRDICSSPKAQKWLEDNVGGGVYMAIAFYTLINATLAHVRVDKSKLGGKTYVPVTSTQLGNDTGDVEVGGGHESQTTKEAKLVAIGERIYKIRYRKVKINGSKEEGFTGTLKPGCWKQLMQVRGNESEGDVILEADLVSEEEDNEEEDEHEEYQDDNSEGEFEMGEEEQT